ncbi:MAG: response regulator [Nitrospiraceae bacterium]|nr:response regulator [Nitrospiraceae bacterium]
MASKPESSATRVLITDDESVICELCQDILEEEGYEVSTAPNGLVAMELLAEADKASRPYAVAMLDIMMPEMDGLELLSHIRRHHPSVQCGIMTGYATLDTCIAAVRLGARFYLLKPFSVSEVKEAIAHAFEDDSTEPQIIRRAPPFGALYPYLVGGLIHDSFNTVWGLKEHAAKLLEESKTGTSSERVSGMAAKMQVGLQHVERVLRLIQQASREYYTPESGESRLTPAYIQSIVDRFRRQNGETDYSCSCSPTFSEQASKFPVGMASQIATELLQNATRACGGRDGAAIRMSVKCEENGKALIFECSDNGPGFSPEALSRIQSGNLRLPEQLGQGGYGLYLIKEITKRLGGFILAENEDAGGAWIQIHIPLEGAADG